MYAYACMRHSLPEIERSVVYDDHQKNDGNGPKQNLKSFSPCIFINFNKLRTNNHINAANNNSSRNWMREREREKVEEGER